MSTRNTEFTWVKTRMFARVVLKLSADKKGKVKISLGKMSLTLDLEYLYDFIQDSLINLDTEKCSEGLKRRRKTILYRKEDQNDC